MRRRVRSGRRKRKKNTTKSTTGSFLGTLSGLHWAFNVVLAGIFFAACVYAQASIVNISAPFPWSGFAVLLLNYGKYLIAFYFLLAAVISFFRNYLYKRKRKRIFKKVQRNNNLVQALSRLDWREFELLIGQVFRERGYSVIEGVGSNDGGVDLTLRKRGRTYLVQCKHWKGNVGVSVVRELYGVMTMRKAYRGYVVCSGRFTKDAAEFAKEANVRLVGIGELKRVLVK